jgi:septation ring formation regulator EzrA
MTRIVEITEVWTSETARRVYEQGERCLRRVVEMRAFALLGLPSDFVMPANDKMTATQLAIIERARKRLSVVAVSEAWDEEVCAIAGTMTRLKMNNTTRQIRLVERDETEGHNP